MNGKRLSVALPAGIFAAAALAVFACGSCALLSKSAPIVPRYFSPERSSRRARPTQRLAGAGVELRLGHVGSAAHLDELLVYRDTVSEIGYYRLRRWTETPANYLERRLARVLFEQRGLRQVVGGSPTLEVQLTAFEEVRHPRHLARVQVVARLDDGRVVRWQQTVTVDLPVVAPKNGDATDVVVEAIGRALRATVDKIADRVVRELAVAPASLPTAAPLTSRR